MDTTIKMIEKDKIELINEYKMEFIDTGINPERAWIPLDYDYFSEILEDLTEFQTVLYLKILFFIAKKGYLEIYSLLLDESNNNKKILACDKLTAKKLGVSVSKWKKFKENLKIQSLFCPVEITRKNTKQLVWLHPFGNFANNKNYEDNAFKQEQVELKFEEDSDRFCILQDKATLQCKEITKSNWFKLYLQYSNKFKTMHIPQSNFYLRVLLEICDKGSFKLEEFNIKTQKINEKLEKENAKLLGLKLSAWKKLKNDPVIQELFYSEKVQVIGSDVVQTLWYHPSGNRYNEQMYEHRKNISNVLNMKKYADENNLVEPKPLEGEVLENNNEISLQQQGMQALEEQQNQILKNYQQSYNKLTKSNFNKEYEPNHWVKKARKDKEYKLLNAKEFYEKYFHNVKNIDNESFWLDHLNKVKKQLDKNKEYISDELFLRYACKFNKNRGIKSPILLDFQLDYEVDKKSQKMRPTLQSAKRYLELPKEGDGRYEICLDFFNKNSLKSIPESDFAQLQEKVYAITDINNLTEQEQSLIKENIEIFIKNLIPFYDGHQVNTNGFKAISSYILSLKQVNIKDYAKNVILCLVSIIGKVNKFINVEYTDSILLEYKFRELEESKQKDEEEQEYKEIPKTKLESLPIKVEKDTDRYVFNLEKVLLFLEKNLLQRECFNLTKNNKPEEIDINKLRHSYKISPLLQKLICLGYTEKDFSETFEENKMNILNNSNRPVYYLLGIMKNQATGISNKKIIPSFN